MSDNANDFLTAFRDFQRKATEVSSSVEDAIRDMANQLGVDQPETKVEYEAGRLFQSTIEITGPEREGTPHLKALQLSPSGLGGGTSLKPGHICVNWKPLCAELWRIAMSYGSHKPKWFQVLVVGRALHCIWKSMKLPLTEQEAMVAWVFWRSIDPGNHLPANLLVAVNAHMTEWSKPSLTQAELDSIMAKLERVGFLRKLDGKRGYAAVDFIVVKYA